MAHAGVADTAERRIVHGRMHHHVIEGYAARQSMFQHVLLLFGVFAEVVQRQRARA
ncbi:hypothetical protein D3C87_1888930 [compost metagenome]